MTLVITLFNNDGTIQKRWKGPSKRRMKTQHKNGTCDWLCSYCIGEIDEHIRKQGWDDAKAE